MRASRRPAPSELGASQGFNELTRVEGVREETARTVANVVLAAAAIGAAVVVFRTPALRRLAFGLARTAITTSIPFWLTREIKQAWADSDVRPETAQRVERTA